MALQETLRHRVQLIPLPQPPRFVAGADAICDRTDQNIYGAMAVFTYPELELVEEAGAAGVCPFPYRTGLLSFREAPILAAAYKRLKQRPDVILVDGQGLAHPRGLGLATHLGLVLEVPTIGVAKSRLIGSGEEPDQDAGAASPLIYQGKEVGLILRTQKGRKPVYLSAGHRITLAESREIVMRCVQRYRSPEPLRQADRLSRRLRSGDLNRQEGRGETRRWNRR
ncbi:MAG: endonuclease V [Syntrophales bacterium]|nr:endonuclease V [Syntrophales bacterium]MDD5642639.1 endonuclease V [Syntrophales bacterium]